MAIFARQALLPEGVAREVRVSFAEGRISEVETAARPRPGDQQVDYLLPGMANLHSHCFQRGFSGLSERRGASEDSFWTWREVMYAFALQLNPDQMQAIAAMACVEMLEAGYARLGEFHYLHHDPEGRRYADPAEMARRIFAATRDTGIGLTLLPVFYAHGGFGPKPAGSAQRRFLHDPDAYLRLIEACEAEAQAGERVGMAPHSLRAVEISQIRALQAALPGRQMHIHIAEQQQEVEECRAFCGTTPVDYLMRHIEIDTSWTMIHATHLTGAECEALAQSGAVAGLCPVTEANLGDGLFGAEAWLAAGGRIGIGTDSNVEITLAGELRLLEYGQRLKSQRRNALSQGGSTGLRLFNAALQGGAQSLGAPAPGITPGAAADVFALRDPFGMEGEAWPDRWIFGRDLQISDSWVAGRHLVQQGRHIARDKVERDYAKVLRELLATAR